MVRVLTALALILLLVSPCFAQQSLVGTYKITSHVVDISGTVAEPYGKAPRGYLVLTPTRAVFFYTGDSRKFGTSVEDKAALFDTIGAWSGTYRVDGSKIIFAVDVSWTENWNGTNVALNWQLSGNRLTLTRDRQPYARDPSKMVEIRQVWEKIE